MDGRLRDYCGVGLFANQSQQPERGLTMILDDPNHVTSIGERVMLYCSSFVASFLLCGVMPIMVFQSWFVIPFSVAAIFFTVPRLYAFLFDRLAASRGSKGESQA